MCSSYRRSVLYAGAQHFMFCYMGLLSVRASGYRAAILGQLQHLRGTLCWSLAAWSRLFTGKIGGEDAGHL